MTLLLFATFALFAVNLVVRIIITAQSQQEFVISDEPSTNFHEYTNSSASIRVFVASIRGRYASTTINLAL